MVRAHHIKEDGDSPFARRVKQCLSERLSPIIVGAVMRAACERCDTSPNALERATLPALLRTLARSLGYYLEPGEVRDTLTSLKKLSALPQHRDERAARSVMDITSEGDIHRARTRAMEVGRQAGLSSYDAIKVATVVSELTRNVIQYADQGTLELLTVSGLRRGLRVVVTDAGPGIRHLSDVLQGHYRSGTGRGMGLKASQRVMDSLEVDSVPGRGTVVTGIKYAG